MRTVIVLPEYDHAEAERKAASEGLPLAEYVQRLVKRDLQSDPRHSEPPQSDPSVIFGMFNSGGSRIADGKRAMISEAIDEQFSAKGL